MLNPYIEIIKPAEPVPAPKAKSASLAAVPTRIANPFYTGEEPARTEIVSHVAQDR
jgi:hypothetical protein